MLARYEKSDDLALTTALFLVSANGSVYLDCHLASPHLTSASASCYFSHWETFSLSDFGGCWTEITRQRRQSDERETNPGRNRGPINGRIDGTRPILNIVNTCCSLYEPLNPLKSDTGYVFVMSCLHKTAPWTLTNHFKCSLETRRLLPRRFSCNSSTTGRTRLKKKNPKAEQTFREKIIPNAIWGLCFCVERITVDCTFPQTETNTGVRLRCAVTTANLYLWRMNLRCGLTCWMR